MSTQPTPTSANADKTLQIKMKVDEIINTAGAAPPAQPAGSAPTPESLQELTRLYYEIYVPGLCQFFESQWFNFQSVGHHNPVSILLHNRPALGLFESFIQALQTVNVQPSQIGYCHHLETRLVWALAKLAYTVPPGSNMPRDHPPPDDNASEARNRVFVYETLVNGDDLLTNPLLPPPQHADKQRKITYKFWYALAEFLRNADRPTQLEHMRAALEGRENRDVLYSLALIRHHSNDFDPDWENRVPDHRSEDQPLNRLFVAREFIKNEALPSGGGTSNVVRHLSWVAGRALVHPGVNLGRRVTG